jgi:hypothetical protein
MLSTHVLSQQRIWLGLQEAMGGHNNLLKAQEPSGHKIKPEPHTMSSALALHLKGETTQEPSVH